MKSIKKYRNSIAVIGCIFICVVLLTRCINSGEHKMQTEEVAQTFAGEATCISCHKEISESHSHTAHQLTSAMADEKNIRGSFAEGENKFVFTPNTLVAMEKRSTGFYQVAYSGAAEKIARKFDIVVGSGTKGQTYLFWNSDSNLFQLPITYFTATSQWCNSPGFPGKVIFNRPITSRCLECHSTYAKTIGDSVNKQEVFDKSSIIYGVTCEKCHGPAAEHVAYQTQHPAEKKAKYIINPASLTRQQNLDMCSLCHGGRMEKTKPSFSFTAGKALADYFVRDTSAHTSTSIDVHGNQLGLLAASKCFKVSNTMTCNSCHNSHVNEAGQTALFSQRCISCHSIQHVSNCKMTGKIDAGTMKNNCIDCHMPLEPSKAIIVMLPGADVPTPAKMRSHYIKPYPEVTKQFIAYINTLPERK